MTVDQSSASVQCDPSVTSLNIRNRSKAKDAFGLLSINGWLLDAEDSDVSLEVEFAGHQKSLPAAEFAGPLMGDGTRLIEFHLVTQMVSNGPHELKAAVILANGKRLEFQPLTIVTGNDSELAREVAADLKGFGTS